MCGFFSVFFFSLYLPPSFLCGGSTSVSFIFCLYFLPPEDSHVKKKEVVLSSHSFIHEMVSRCFCWFIEQLIPFSLLFLIF
jgi:hypothetical protein